MSELSPDPLPGSYRTVDGVKLWCVEAGAGDPPIVLLHGIPTSSYLWRNVQRPLSARHRVIAHDLMGLGKSERPSARSFRLEDQAQLLAGLLDDLGLRQVVLVAHDIGGAVMHHFVRAHPERVAAQVVMNAVAFAASWPVPLVRAMRAPVLGDLASMVPSRLVLRRELRRGVFHRERMSGAVFDHYAQPVSGLAGRRHFLEFIRGMDAASAEDALRATADLDVPRLILWGEDDPFQRIEFGRRLHQLWKGSTFVPIARAGHFLQEDQPLLIAEAIEGFLERGHSPGG